MRPLLTADVKRHMRTTCEQIVAADDDPEDVAGAEAILSLLDEVDMLQLALHAQS